MTASVELAAFLGTHRAEVLEDFARRTAELAPHPMTRAGLLDHVPAFLDEVVVALRDSAAARGSEAIVGEVARAHGLHRIRQGYPVEAMVREYAVLSDCIFDRLSASDVLPRISDLRVLVDCIAAASADAVLEFTRQRAIISDDEQRHLVEEATRRTAAEAALRLSETRFRTLFESIDDGFCLIRMIDDAAGVPVDYRFLEVNDAFARQTGLVGAVGKTVRELVPAHDAWWFEIYGRVAATGVPQRFENEALALGRWFDVYATRSGDPALREVAVVFKDITARKRTEAEHRDLLAREQAARKDAEAASQLRDQFLATVSHELRTPLSAILGWTQMLRSEALPEDKRDRALETIERNARAQAQLIEDLLDVSRIVAGQLRIEPQVVDLKHVVDAAVETVTPAAIARDVNLTTEVPGGTTVMGDVARLQQVMWNLLSNSVKFTPAGGQATVTLRASGGSVELVVRDTGKGIAPAFQPHVFERFRQAEGETSRSAGGLGLGLSIVKELVHLHGGTVAVFSEGEGRGTTVTVRLPALRRTREQRSP